MLNFRIKILFAFSFLLFLVSCKNLLIISPDIDGGVNNDPYPLVSPGNVNILVGENSIDTFQLESSVLVPEPFLNDEDGDTVSVVVDPLTPLPTGVTINTTTGLVSIDNSLVNTGSSIILKFWTIDDRGGSTEAQVFTVTIGFIF